MAVEGGGGDSCGSEVAGAEVGVFSAPDLVLAGTANRAPTEEFVHTASATSCEPSYKMNFEFT